MFPRLWRLFLLVKVGGMEGRALGNDEDTVRGKAVLVCTQEMCAIVLYF